MSDKTDIELWQAIQAGEESAFLQLFHIYYEMLYQFAGRFLFDAQSAENIVQDVFVQLWINRNDYQINASLKAFLYTAVKNQCLNYIKQNNKLIFKFPENESKNLYINSPEEKYIEKELSESIKKAINLLPQQCRQIYLLKRHENLKYSEIADQLNISVNTVKTQLKRAFKFLLEKISPLLQSFFLY